MRYNVLVNISIKSHDAGIYPSIFAFQTLNIGSEIIKFNNIASGFHIDIIDGIYVSGFGFPIYMAKMIKNYTDLPIHLHIMAMIDNVILEIIELKPDLVFLHADSTNNIDRIIADLQNAKIDVGIVVSNFIELVNIQNILKKYKIQNILLMCVKPGKCGQKFLEDKFLEIKKIRSEYSKMNIMIDGGVTPEVVKKIIETSDFKEKSNFVVGSGLYKYNWD